MLSPEWCQNTISKEKPWYPTRVPWSTSGSQFLFWCRPALVPSINWDGIVSDEGILIIFKEAGPLPIWRSAQIFDMSMLLIYLGGYRPRQKGFWQLRSFISRDRDVVYRTLWRWRFLTIMKTGDHQNKYLLGRHSPWWSFKTEVSLRVLEKKSFSLSWFYHLLLETC